jgi:hypothetical protein
MNHLFFLQLTGIDSSKTPISLESHLEFIWVTLEDVGKYNLLPEPLVQLLEFNEIESFRAWWASNIRAQPDA